MLNTYINDNSMSPYPFRSKETLPFPMSCIVGMGVCLYSSSTVVGVKATAVELSSAGCAVTLATVGGVYLVTISAKSGETSAVVDFNDTDNDISGTAFVSCGIIPQQAYGTYQGAWVIDPSCVMILSDTYMGHDPTVVVNGVEHKTDDVLRLAFSGYFAVDINDNDAVISADVPDNAATTVARLGDNYDIVTGIGTARIKEHHGTDYTGSIALELDSNIKCTFQNARYASDVVPDADADITRGPRHKYGYSYNDDRGDTVILTLYGTREFPNCYAPDEDEADDIEGID